MESKYKRSILFLFLFFLFAGCATFFIQSGLKFQNTDNDPLQNCCEIGWNSTNSYCEKYREKYVADVAYSLGSLSIILAIPFLFTWHPNIKDKIFHDIFFCSVVCWGFSLILFIFLGHVFIYMRLANSCENSNYSIFSSNSNLI